MARRKEWQGPFEYKTDGTCVKCDKRQEYFVNVSGITLGACREHAIEAACSREGGRTIAEATLELDDIDRERWRQRNTFTACWVPVTERLPEMGETVMVAHSKDGWVGTGERVLTGAYLHWADDGEELHDPTHWMPLPAPPTDAK